MKPLISILLLIYSLNAFGQQVNYPENSLTGRWHLVMFKDVKTGQMTDTASMQNGWLASYKNVILDFADNRDSGTIIGHTFCNDIEGTYVIDSSKFTINRFGSTLVGCQYEDKLDNALHQVSKYKRGMDSLIIYYNNDSEEMVFRAVKKRSDNDKIKW